MGARPMKLENDLPKRQKPQVVDYLRIPVHRESSMKQYVVLRLILSRLSFGNLLLLLNCNLACSCSVALVFTTE
jgi:hypothetical protein